MLGLFFYLLSCCFFASPTHADGDVLALNSPSDIDRIFSPSTPTFIKFYAPWCGHCKSLAPTWSKLATTLKDDVIIAHVDCTIEDHSYCTMFGVRSYPTLKLIADGKVYPYAGERKEEELTKFAKGGYKDTQAGDLPKKPPVLGDYIDAAGNLREIDHPLGAALEQAVGLLPHPTETSFPAQPLHPSLKGTPGPSPSIGSPDAPIKLFLWSDFQCPNCRRAAEPLKWLTMKYPEVQVIFKQLPLEMHKKALPAAKASLAAAKQGKFWEYHDLIWKTRKINADELEGHARTLGLDIIKWQADRDSEQIQKEIEYDISLSAALGLSGTPGMVINGRVGKGWGSVFGIENTIKQIIRALPEVQKQTTDPNLLPYLSTRQADVNIADYIWGISPAPEKTEL